MRRAQPGVIFGASPPYKWTFAPVPIENVLDCQWRVPYPCPNAQRYIVYAASETFKQDSAMFRLCQEHADGLRRALVTDPHSSAIEDRALRETGQTPSLLERGAE